MTENESGGEGSLPGSFSYAPAMQAKTTVDDRGAITIPAAMRQDLGLEANDE